MIFLVAHVLILYENTSLIKNENIADTLNLVLDSLINELICLKQFYVHSLIQS